VRSALSRTLLAFAAALLLAQCGVLRPVGEPAANLPRVEPQGNASELPEVLPRVRAGDSPIGEVLNRATEHATALCAAHTEEPGEGLELGEYGENDDTNAFTEAWLRVDEAVVFAGIAVAPPPPIAPVSIETQRIATEERQVPPGELHVRVDAIGEVVHMRLYDNQGRMRPDAVRAFSWALRDRRANRARTLEPRLLAMLYIVGQYFDAELRIVSGYRIRGVNASRGSRHGGAAAADFRVPNVGLRTTLAFVESTFMNAGVGYYPTSRFVHIDSRERTYYWVDSSGPGQRSRTRSRSSSRRGTADTDPTMLSIHMSEAELYRLPPSYRAVGYE
jgi:uncharacterized protein YcbK (DUF882 family)